MCTCLMVFLGYWVKVDVLMLARILSVGCLRGQVPCISGKLQSYKTEIRIGKRKLEIDVFKVDKGLIDI